jgi:hypothetical protein
MTEIPIQETGPFLREGLPYWIFWLLLSLILLLLIVIFLRDKDLRRRLSLALAGAKRRMQRTRLRLRLNREKRRKAELFRQLGRMVWTARIHPDRFGLSFDRLERLEAETAGHHSALKDITDESTALQTRQEETRQNRRNLADSAALRAAKAEDRDFQRRIRDLERKSKTERGQLKRLGREKLDQYERLGALIDEFRIEHPDLLGFYVQVDKVNRAILAAMDKIEKLG